MKNIGKMYNYVRRFLTTREIEMKISCIIQEIGESCIFDGSYSLRDLAIKELYNEYKD